MTIEPIKLAFKVKCTALDHEGYRSCKGMLVVEAEIDEQHDEESATFLWAPYAFIPGDVPKSCPTCGTTFDLHESFELEKQIDATLDQIRAQLAGPWRDAHKHLPLPPDAEAFNLKTGLTYITMNDEVEP